MTISPDWPWIAVTATLAGCAYAAVIRWLNDHPRYGLFWSAQSWVEVAGGNCLIDATAGLIAGLDVALLVLGLNVVWGLPMIIGTLGSQAIQHAKETEQRIADSGHGQ